MKNILIFLGIAALIYWFKNRDKVAAAGTSSNWLKSGLFGLFPTSATAPTAYTRPIQTRPTSPTVSTDSATGGSSTDGNVYTGTVTDGMVAAASFTSFSKPKSAFL